MAPEIRPGDWTCDACGNVNFAKRQACNRCHAPRPDGGGVGGYGPARVGGSLPSAEPYAKPPLGADGEGAPGRSQPGMKDGDWVCPQCGNHNFAHRVNCNKCGLVREGMREGDWICRNCKNHNFARQMVCKKCSAPRAMSDTGKGGGRGVGPQMVVGGGGPPMVVGGGGGGDMMDQMLQQAYMAGMAAAGGGGMMMGAPPRVGGRGPVVQGQPKGMKEGDWLCTACGNHNFASRTSCNRCQAMRPGYRTGDWICPSCRAHNFASKEACHKCNAPKPASA